MPSNPGLEIDRSRLVRAVVLALAVVTLLLYWPVLTFDFVNYDDPAYVPENPLVTQGLSGPGILWAFTTGYMSNWHPLTWLSHMLDCQLFGLNPGPAHLVNVLIHTLNAVLLFLVLRRLTGALWRSALVAALFAWHPLHVESVAWISERKDVLSTLFWLLATWQYARWARRPTRGGYALLALLFALGLMSKPMLVTLPCALLLLDFWPLGRWPREAFASSAAFRATAGKLVWEKWPLFLLATLSCAVTFLVQQAGKSVSTFDEVPLPYRLANVLVSYAWYAGKTFWPSNLCVLYPLAPQVGWQVAGAVALLAAVSWLAFRWAASRPWFLVGWLWFLGTLVPVIGIVQVGGQARADRYMYVPGIGLFMLAVWTVDAWLPALRRRRAAAVAASALALGGSLAVTASQLPFWRDGEVLMKRALAVTRDNSVAHNNLGFTLTDRGHYAEARRHFAEALRINPGYAEAKNGLGYALAEQGRFAEAAGHYQDALKIDPDFVAAHVNLGWALAQLGKLNEAVARYRDALRLAPNNLYALNNLGLAYLSQQHPAQAVEYHRKALAVAPANANTHYLLGNALAQLGRADEAAACYAQSAQLQPNNPDALARLGARLAVLGRLEAAMDCYRRALAVQPAHAAAQYNLANALARLGHRKEALTHYALAVRIKPDHLPARFNFGMTLSDLGRFDEAAAQFEAALQLNPDYPEAHAACGFARVKTGRFAEAAAHYAEALRLRPDWVAILDQWARLRATHPSAQLRNGQEAVRLAERARQLTGDPSAARLDTLAAAYAEAGRFDQAVATARQALQLARQAQAAQLAEQVEARLRQYESGKPWREQP